MRPSSELESLVLQMSREVAILCSDQGLVLWADRRAVACFGSLEGEPLAKHAVPGTEQKVTDYLADAAKRAIQRCELSLVCNNKPATFAFRSEPTPDGPLLVGHYVSADETETFARVAATMTELGELHRETDRQRNEIAVSYANLDRAHKDLLDSNRALLTMHDVLDDKNDALRRASDIKTRVVANVSHEFRTPINSILGLTQLLLDRLDGDLTPEQEKQVRFVRTSAESLSNLVNDLLDLSRIEAGRYDLRASEIDVSELLSSLRGMMRPLLRPGVELVIDEIAPGTITMNTDGGKIAQVLRNLVSNAIKFTRQGEIRVTVSEPINGRVRFDVTDTGIGIAPEDQERIFDEFAQVHGDHQKDVKGTGLGLALSRRLAEILGGSLNVKSALGKGSTFIFEIPALHEEVATIQTIAENARSIDSSKDQVLVVEDNRQTLFFYERYLSGAGFQIMPARSVDEARLALSRVRPSAIVLDVMLDGEVTWRFLTELKDDPSTRDIPVMVVTVVDSAQKARALGADEFWLKPIDGDRLIRKLGELSKRGPASRVLVIDDDDAARYLIRKLLTDSPFTVFEAADGATGVKMAQTHRPDVIVLDFILEKETAFDVIDDLKANPATRSIPIIIQTAKTLDQTERAKLERETAAILRKQSLSREVAITRIREALEAAGVRVAERSS